MAHGGNSIIAPHPQHHAKPALLSVAVPVGIKGNFEDFDLSIHSADVGYSLFRNAANIVFLGLPLLFQKPQEEDGKAACIDLTARRPAGSESSDRGGAN